MTYVLLDGLEMQNKQSVHAYLQEMLQIEGYFGNNLDALWDSLSSQSTKLHIVLKNHQVMIKQLGSYGLSLTKIFEEVAIENNYITFEVK